MHESRGTWLWWRRHKHKNLLQVPPPLFQLKLKLKAIKQRRAKVKSGGKMEERNGKEKREGRGRE
jgi:hypothetical protein